MRGSESECLDWDFSMDRIAEAARNNAHLYQRVCASHGCRTELSESYLICLDPPPRYFGQAVTLAPNALAVLEPRLTKGFKDSFHDAEPVRGRFEVLFDASWIWGEPKGRAALGLDWREVGTDRDLMEWESGWASGDDEAKAYPRQFPASLLDFDDLRFFGGWMGGSLAAGALFNQSGSVVGISNAFALQVSEDELWSELEALASLRFPNLPVTGYERGQSLTSAMLAGFEEIAPLRVWARRE